MIRYVLRGKRPIPGRTVGLRQYRDANGEPEQGWRQVRFIFLTQYYPPEPGAASLRLEAMTQALCRHGHEVSVVTAFPHHLGARDTEQRYRRRLLREEQRDGVRVVRTWIWRVPPDRFWWRLLNYFSFVVSSWFGLCRLGRADYLVVESPPLFLGITAVAYGWWRRIPLILSVSDLWPESAVALGLVTHPLPIRLARRLEYFLYRRARWVSVVTEGIREGVLASGQVKPEQILFFPNGVDLDRFRMVDPDPGLVRRLGVEGRQVFLYPGTLGYAQGLQVIVEAAERLRERRDICFLLVGEGPVKADLQRAVQAKGLEASVIFEGLQPAERMPGYFSLATAVVVPLRRHRLFRGARPSKIFPAWAVGVPVIFVGEGETAGLVEASGGGLVVPPEDGAALAEAVVRLADLPEAERLAMGQRGRAFVARHYTWQGIADRWLAALQR